MTMRRIVKKLIVGPRKVIRRAVGRAEFVRSIRPSDVFIVTFPKSGTNWVGFFLALVAADRSTGERSVLTLDESRRWVAGVNDEYFGGARLPEEPRLQDPRVFKVHAPYDEALGRVIYLARDPRDVMVSYYYHQLRKKQQFDVSIDEYVERNDTWPGDWGDHVSGWLAHADREDVLFLRYEDLKASTVASFRNIVDFCGLGLREDELADYIGRSSFENMRRAEEAVGAPEAGDIRFTRKGVVGDWMNELSPRSVGLIEERYRDLMVSLGYELASGSSS